MLPRGFFFLLLSLLAAATPHCVAAQTPAEAATLAAHHTVAVLPFDVEVRRLHLRDFTPAGADTLAAAPQQQLQQWQAAQQPEAQQVAYQMQDLVCANLLKHAPKHGYRVQFQAVAETNRRLLAAGISYATLRQQSPAQMRQVLGVDALLSGQVLLVQPLPKAMALAIRLLTNEPLLLRQEPSAIMPSRTTASLTLDDCQTGALLWHFDFDRLGDNALKPERLAPRLVKEALPVFPYCQP